MKLNWRAWLEEFGYERRPPDPQKPFFDVWIRQLADGRACVVHEVEVMTCLFSPWAQKEKNHFQRFEALMAKKEHLARKLSAEHLEGPPG